MKIEEVISGKNDHEEVVLGGLSAPVSALKRAMQKGYINIVPYETEGTFSMWGKNCTACLTPEQLREWA